MRWSYNNYIRFVVIAIIIPLLDRLPKGAFSSSTVAPAIPPSPHWRTSTLWAGAVLLSLLLPHTLRGQGHAPTTGTEFWLGFMHNFEGGAQVLEVFVSGRQNTSGTISAPRLGWSETFTVTAYETTVLSLPAWAEHTSSETVEEKGLRIVTQDTVSVHAINFRTYSADASAVFPVQTVGTHYRTQGYPGFYQNNQIDYRSELLIVATEDETELEITPSTATMGGRAQGETFSIQLDAGQSYQIKAANGWGDLTGTLIEGSATNGTCRPFAVFSGAQCARVPASCTACDHLFHQNLPSTSWGTRYFLVPFAGASSYSYRILGDHPNTALHINGTGPVHLQAGQTVDFNGQSGAVLIEGDKPFSVGQFMEGTSCAGNGDPAFLLVNTEDQRIDDITFATVESDTIDQHYLNIVVRSDATGQVLLNGLPLAPTLFTPFPAHPSMSYATLTIAPGSHRLQCPAGLTAYVYGIGTWETYVYSAGSRVPMPSYTKVDVDCGNGPGGTTVLSSPVPLLDPYWTLEGAAEEDTLHTGPVYTFIPSEPHVIVLSGVDPHSGCIMRFHFHVEMPSPIAIVGTPHGCAPHTTTLSGPEATVSQCFWELSDGTLIEGCDVEHLFIQPGSHDITLTVVSENGCRADTMLVGAVLVHPPPVVSFTSGPEQACSGQGVLFTNTMPPGSYTECTWTFSDGDTATGCTVSHSFTTPGVHSATLLATTSNGCTGSLTQDGPVVLEPIVPSFSTTPSVICPGGEVNFINTTEGSDGTQCHWSFGDGGTAEGCIAAHIYDEPGVYDVSLSIVPEGGCPSEALTPSLILVLTPPHVSFTSEPTTGCEPLHVVFTNTSHPGTWPLSNGNAIWDLGNGQPGNTYDISTTYTSPGRYPVVLSMTDTLGCGATAIDTVVVYPAPEVLFFMDADSVCLGTSISFINGTSLDLVEHCLWDFGDGTFSSECSTSHSYPSTGVYNVRLTVNSPQGCTADTTMGTQATVLPVPEAGFMHQPLSPDIMHPEVVFTDLSQGGVSGRTWWFGTEGELGTSEEVGPTLIFPHHTPGEYPVTLVVSNGYCTDTVWHSVMIADVLLVHVPNAFSPDGDGLNDLFRPVFSTDLSDGFELSVFDRWGVEVFHTTDPDKGWDGTAGGHAPVIGVYVWQLRVQDMDGAWTQYSGHVTLLR